LQPFGIAAAGFWTAIGETAIGEVGRAAMSRARLVVLIETPSNPLNPSSTCAWCAASPTRSRRARARPGRRLRQHAARPGLPEAAAARRRYRRLFLTKYVGGHSDLIAGAALGSQAHMRSVKLLRGANRHAARSAFGVDARPLARDAVAAHDPPPAATPRSSRSFSPSTRASARSISRRCCPRTTRRGGVFEQQCGAAGATFSFDVKAARGRPSGSSTHSRSSSSRSASRHRIADLPSGDDGAFGRPRATRERIGISDATIRLSIGIENADDLVARSDAGRWRRSRADGRSGAGLITALTLTM